MSRTASKCQKDGNTLREVQYHEEPNTKKEYKLRDDEGLDEITSLKYLGQIISSYGVAVGEKRTRENLGKLAITTHKRT